jgi:hypothetical protein
VVTEAPAHAIEGTDAEVALLEGDVAVVLLHVARRLLLRGRSAAPGRGDRA